MAKTKTTRKTARKPRGKFVGIVVKELRTKGQIFKVGDSYDAIEEGSYKFLINAGYIASKK